MDEVQNDPDRKSKKNININIYNINNIFNVSAEKVYISVNRPEDKTTEGEDLKKKFKGESVFSHSGKINYKTIYFAIIIFFLVLSIILSVLSVSKNISIVLFLILVVCLVSLIAVTYVAFEKSKIVLFSTIIGVFICLLISFNIAKPQTILSKAMKYLENNFLNDSAIKK